MLLCAICLGMLASREEGKDGESEAFRKLLFEVLFPGLTRGFNLIFGNGPRFSPALSHSGKRVLKIISSKFRCQLVNPVGGVNWNFID